MHTSLRCTQHGLNGEMARQSERKWTWGNAIIGFHHGLCVVYRGPEASLLQILLKEWGSAQHKPMLTGEPVPRITFKTWGKRDFPGDPVAKTTRSQWRRLGSTPGQGMGPYHQGPYTPQLRIIPLATTEKDTSGCCETEDPECYN